MCQECAVIFWDGKFGVIFWGGKFAVIFWNFIFENFGGIKGLGEDTLVVVSREAR